jgi:hypothetical protein
VHQRPTARASGVTKSAPQGFLGTRSGESEARGEPGGGVALALVDVGGSPGHVAEHRVGHPPVDELGHRVHRRSAIHRIEALGQRSVRPSPLGPFVRVVDAGRSRDQHEASHQVRSFESEVQAEPGTHRVAEVVGRPARLSQQGRALDEVGADVGRSSVSGQVEQDQSVVDAQVIGQATPQPAGLGEAVGHDQAGPFAERLGVQYGRGHRRWQ